MAATTLDGKAILGTIKEELRDRFCTPAARVRRDVLLGEIARRAAALGADV